VFGAEEENIHRKIKKKKSRKLNKKNGIEQRV
jgi:hypothetical protein